MPFSYDINADDANRIRRRSQHTGKQERIEYKALGQNIGSLARGAVAFDPNAQDGDGDGLVQDNTPYERPAVLTSLVNTLRQGLASTTGDNSLFTNGASPTKGMTNRQVAEYAVPDSPMKFLELRLQQHALLRLPFDNPYTQEELDSMSFDPEKIEQLRQLVERTLDERPALRVAWDRFGVPPIGVATGDKAYSGVFLRDSILMHENSLTSKPVRNALSESRIARMFASVSIGAIRIKGVNRPFVGRDPKDTLTHEWGHYLHQLTANLHPDQKNREAAALLEMSMWSYYDEHDRHPRIKALFDYMVPASENYDKVNDAPDDSVPFVSTGYATTQPDEFVAEAINAYFSPDKKARALLNEEGVALIEEVFLGISPGRGGLASQNRTATTGSAMRGLTPSEMAEIIVPSTLEEALASLDDHHRLMTIEGLSTEVNTDALKSVVLDGVDALDFSPEAVAEMRASITQALSNNRMFREAVERHGFPPVMSTKRGAKWDDGDNTYAVSMIEGFPAIVVNQESRNQLLGAEISNDTYKKEGMLKGTDRFLVSPREDAMLAHEWGHYINRLALASHPDPEIRALAAFWFGETWDMDLELKGVWKALNKMGVNVGSDKVSQRLLGAQRFGNKVKNNKSERWNGYPHVMSQYGQSMPAETFAEGVVAILVSDANLRDMVSPTLREDIFDIIGKPEVYRRDITRGISEERAGLASFSIPRNPSGTILVPQTASEAGAELTPLGGRDWLKDATNEEIADTLAVRSVDDWIALTFMNMTYGQDPSLMSPLTQTGMMDALAEFFFPQLAGNPSNFADFSPQGVERTRRIIKKALDSSPEFAWLVRTFGSVPVVTVDPVQVDAALMMQKMTGAQLVAPEIEGLDIMGWSVGPLGIVINTSSRPGRKQHEIGQRQRATGFYTTSEGNIEEFLFNTDISMEGTLYHEWFHSFFSRVIGWHDIVKPKPGPLIPGTRQQRQDYLFPGVANVDAITRTIKNMFDPEGFIPYSTKNSKPIIDKARRKIARNNDTEQDFIDIMKIHDASIGSRGELWNPEIAQLTLESIKARYPYLVDDMAPLLRAVYGSATRQEQFAEGGVLFVTPDTREALSYLPPETEALYAFIFGLKSDPSVGSYDRPWAQRSGLASRSSSSQRSIRTLNERVHTSKEVFVQAGEAHRRTDAVSQSNGMTDISVNGYKFSIAGELPEWREAYESWNDWQENWRMRYISSELMGLDALSSQSDTGQWRSITNNHIKDGTIAEASSDARDEIQRSAMMSLSLMKEISNSPYASDAPLYRSINNVGVGDTIARVNVGETLSMPLTSFSPDYDSVVAFSKNDNEGSLSDALRETSGVIVKLREGVSVVYSPVTKPTPNADGRESNMPIEAITAGEFVVKSKTNVNGVDIIELEQSRVIDPILGSLDDQGRKKAETNKRRVELNQEMTKSLERISEKLQESKDAATLSDEKKANDDISFEAKRYGAITRSLRSRNDEFDKLDTPRTIGGLASSSPIEDRANRHGVSLEAFNDENYDADDIEWSTNDWSLGKTNQVRAGDVVVVRTRKDGKKEILTIERKSGPFRGALSLPGGLQDEGEDLYDTAEREMLEEVNVSPTDAMDRRILGQVDVKDWDPRFVEGGRIAGIRFDLSEEQSSVVKAGDDAGKFNWIDVEEMSTGKYPIAFGHASWLAEAFADDPVLGPRFAVLAEASRVRNQRLIKKIDEKRKEKGIKEFGEMPDPALPYTATTEGVRVGMASAAMFDRNISVSPYEGGIIGDALELNAGYLNANPIKDGYYGRDIDGVWAQKIAKSLKKDKINHQDALGIYLALAAINDEKAIDGQESISQAFMLRDALHKMRDIVSSKDNHFVREYKKNGRTVWTAYRGRDSLGEYSTPKQAQEVVQESIAQRSIEGLASSSMPLRRSDSDIPQKAQEAMQEKIDSKRDELQKLEDTNRRLKLAIEELKETGSWQGEKHDTRVNIEGNSPARTYTKEQIKEMAEAEGKSYEELVSQIVNDAKASENRRNKQIETAKDEIESLENRKQFIGKERGENSFHIDELLADPEVEAELRQRTAAIGQMDKSQVSERFSDPDNPKVVYVVHWGASELQGGQLDPSLSRGQVGQGLMGNTRQVNNETARYVVELRDKAKADKTLLEEMRTQVEETGKIDFRKIAQQQPSNPYAAGRARMLVGAERDSESTDGVTTRRIEELISDRDRTLSRLDKVADQLVADDYQYMSTYRASMLQELFSSYGGRYQEEGSSEWGDNKGKSPNTGIHVFRVLLDEDAMEQNSVGETHLVGKHTPIASLVADNSPDSSNPASGTWIGWMDMVVQQDKESRAGLASESLRGEVVEGDFHKVQKSKINQEKIDSIPEIAEYSRHLDRFNTPEKRKERIISMLEGLAIRDFTKQSVDEALGDISREIESMAQSGLFTQGVNELRSADAQNYWYIQFVIEKAAEVLRRGIYRDVLNQGDSDELADRVDMWEIDFRATDPSGGPSNMFEEFLPLIEEMNPRDTRGKTVAWVDLSTKSFINDAPLFDAKSLNYTKPELRQRLKNRIMAGSKGGNPGQWSARKAQLLAVEYRNAGGGYRGGVRKTQRSLKKWTREKWRTSDGKPAIRKGGTRRYLPSSAWGRLTPAQRSATNRKKITGSRSGNQFVANTRSAANASRRARD